MLRMALSETAPIRRALPNFLNFMRFLHPALACSSGVRRQVWSFPAESWVGMGPCCIVKAEGTLCLIYGFRGEKPLQIGRDVEREVIGKAGIKGNRRAANRVLELSKHNSLPEISPDRLLFLPPSAFLTRPDRSWWGTLADPWCS